MGYMILVTEDDGSIVMYGDADGHPFSERAEARDQARTRFGDSRWYVAKITITDTN